MLQRQRSTAWPRKGKTAATSSTRSRKAPSVKEVEETLSPITEDPSVEEQDEPIPEPIYDSEEAEEEPIPGRLEVWLTKELLEEMRQFDDQKRIAVYKERCSVGKMVKSGKQYSSRELKMIACDKEFRACIQSIGFEWLLQHSQERVPVDLAREFFSTFRLKNTTDLDADSITFRLLMRSMR